MGDNIMTATLPYSFVPDRVRSRSFKKIDTGLLNSSGLKILEFLGANEHAKIKQIAEEFDFSVPAVKNIISKLKSNGYLVNEGNNRLNEWKRL